MDNMQKSIITNLKVSPEINTEDEVRRSINFLKTYFTEHPFLKTMVLGISGGQDSTLVGKLAQMAAEELRTETGDPSYKFIAMALPYGIQADATDMEDAMTWISPDQRIDINIKDSVDAIVGNFETEEIKLSDFNIGNIKARIRMVTQFAMAGDHQGVVLGTDHAAESVTGFYTKFGDGAADLMPIYRLNKRQGRQILEFLKAPKHLIYKIPTADLEEDRPMLADEEALGVTYEAIDDYLEGKSVDESSKLRIEQLYRQSEHKRHGPITVFDDFWKSF